MTPRAAHGVAALQWGAQPGTQGSLLPGRLTRRQPPGPAMSTGEAPILLWFPRKPRPLGQLSLPAPPGADGQWDTSPLAGISPATAVPRTGTFPRTRAKQQAGRATPDTAGGSDVAGGRSGLQAPKGPRGAEAGAIRPRACGARQELAPPAPLQGSPTVLRLGARSREAAGGPCPGGRAPPGRAPQRPPGLQGLAARVSPQASREPCPAAARRPLRGPAERSRRGHAPLRILSRNALIINPAGYRLLRPTERYTTGLND